jgi:hypothetical protein
VVLGGEHHVPRTGPGSHVDPLRGVEGARLEVAGIPTAVTVLVSDERVDAEVEEHAETGFLPRQLLTRRPALKEATGSLTR